MLDTVATLDISWWSQCDATAYLEMLVGTESCNGLCNLRQKKWTILASQWYHFEVFLIWLRILSYSPSPAQNLFNNKRARFRSFLKVVYTSSWQVLLSVFYNRAIMLCISRASSFHCCSHRFMPFSCWIMLLTRVLLSSFSASHKTDYLTMLFHGKHPSQATPRSAAGVRLF